MHEHVSKLHVVQCAAAHKRHCVRKLLLPAMHLLPAGMQRGAQSAPEISGLLSCSWHEIEPCQDERTFPAAYGSQSVNHRNLSSSSSRGRSGLRSASAAAAGAAGSRGFYLYEHAGDFYGAGKSTTSRQKPSGSQSPYNGQATAGLSMITSPQQQRVTGIGDRPIQPVLPISSSPSSGPLAAAVRAAGQDLPAVIDPYSATRPQHCQLQPQQGCAVRMLLDAVLEAEPDASCFFSRAWWTQVTTVHQQQQRTRTTDNTYVAPSTVNGRGCGFQAVFDFSSLCVLGEGWAVAAAGLLQKAEAQLAANRQPASGWHDEDGSAATALL